MPAEASIGQEFMYEIDLAAAECVGNVVVTDMVPAGATYVRSEPPAQVNGNQLIWRFPSMDAGATQVIKVWVKADKEGTLVSCATVTADPRMCASIFVGKPALAIEKTGPETALVGTDIMYNVTVKNTGTMVVKDVELTDAVPDGLSHSSGKNMLSFTIGDLGPGQSKSVPVTLKALKAGRFCNVATATSSNAGKVSDDACTKVIQALLKVAKSGTKEQFTGRKADYAIVVSNAGDADLANVVVTDSAPAETTILTAEGASVSGNTATWTIPMLKAGENKSFKIELTARAAGTFCNRVTAASGALKESAEACTVWKGQAALLIEVVDDPDPIGIGVPTTITIRVTNQGTADDNNVLLLAEFEDELDPVSATNGGTVSGKKVTWAPYPRLAAKQSFEYKVVAKGVALGDHRLKVLLTSDLLKRPVTEEESTHVY